VLRYEVGGGGGRRTVYGKVFDDGRSEFVADVLQALDGRLRGTAVPKLYGTVPELQLSLMEALPGAPALAGELRSPGGRPDQLVGDAARTAAALHQADVELGTRRSMDDTLDELLELLLLVERIAPALADTLEGVLHKIVAAAYSTSAMPLQLSHGDLAPSQLLAGPAGGGLVDFDSVGQAEAALDLGHYLAYLRLAVAKACPGDADLADLLAGLYLTSYVETAGLDTTPPALTGRVEVYECVSLFRTTVHAWQKLKGPRTRTVFGILSEQAARLNA
jgi:aminoglycoside phosphotransferase (APT) family kinase protein